MRFFDWLFGQKRNNGFEEEIKHSFTNVKKDISKVSKWLDHFHKKHKGHEEDFSKVLSRLGKVEKDLEDAKNFIEFFVAETSHGPFRSPFKRLSKQPQTAVQTGGVQTPVQTAVQTGALKGLTMMERVILFALLNSKEKLSYDDLSILVGKDKSTVRGQINNIKQKSEGLLSEISDGSGKKRFYVEDRVIERVLDDIILSKKARKAEKRVKLEKIEVKRLRKRGK